MKRIYSVTLVALSLLAITFFFTDFTQAQCNTVGMTADGGEVVLCSGSETNGLDTTDFQDAVTMQGGNMTDVGIVVAGTRDGDDTININSYQITGSICIDSGDGNDTIEGINANLDCSRDCINATRGNDTIIFTDSNLDCEGPSGINAASDNDTIILENTRISSEGTAVNAASGDDQITLGDNVELIRSTGPGDNITCSTGFDILTFAMTVPDNQLAALSAEIAAADPANGNITINGLYYEWNACEVLENRLNAQSSSPVPTLSEWGMIAMAAILGIFGFIVARKRFQFN